VLESGMECLPGLIVLFFEVSKSFNVNAHCVFN
jgi:hypothetical protein